MIETHQDQATDTKDMEEPPGRPLSKEGPHGMGQDERKRNEDDG